MYVETAGLITTTLARGIRAWYDAANNPPHLSKNALMLLQRFKRAHDRKNAGDLDDVISDYYEGDVFDDYEDKDEFIDVVRENLAKLRFGFAPFTTINLYHIIRDDPEEMSAIIDVTIRLRVAFVPTPIIYDSVQLLCTANPEGKNGVWRITSLRVQDPEAAEDDDYEDEDEDEVEDDDDEEEEEEDEEEEEADEEPE